MPVARADAENHKKIPPSAIRQFKRTREELQIAESFHRAAIRELVEYVCRVHKVNEAMVTDQRCKFSPIGVHVVTDNLECVFCR